MKYKNYYISLHNKNYFRGLSTLSHVDDISLLIKQTSSKCLLDYGSGKGQQYSKHHLDKVWNVEVDCYDPFYEPFSKIPEKLYDGTICIEVLEHIPEEELDTVLDTIFSKTKKFVLFTACSRPANKFFEDGTNVHVTIKDYQWWLEKIKPHNVDNIIVEIIITS